MTWKDVTSYSRGQERTPQAWEAQAGGIRITVHRLHGIPDTWFLSDRVFFKDYPLVDCHDVDAAKAEAATYVRERLEEALAALK